MVKKVMPWLLVGILILAWWLFSSFSSRSAAAAAATPGRTVMIMSPDTRVPTKSGAASRRSVRVPVVYRDATCDLRGEVAASTEGQPVICKPVPLSVGDDPPLRWQR